MGFLDILKGSGKASGIDRGVEQFRGTPGALLLDVRTPEEYAGGHIPGSRSLPLDDMVLATEHIPERDTPIFLYCLSGARSRQAAYILRQLGYTAVTNIGGIKHYHGEVER